MRELLLLLRRLRLRELMLLLGVNLHRCRRCRRRGRHDLVIVMVDLVLGLGRRRVGQLSRQNVVRRLRGRGLLMRDGAGARSLLGGARLGRGLDQVRGRMHGLVVR